MYSELFISSYEFEKKKVAKGSMILYTEPFATFFQLQGPLSYRLWVNPPNWN